MDGAPYLYPAAAREEIVQALRDDERLSEAPDPAAFFKSAAPLFHWLWLDHAAQPPTPALVTAEGDPFVFARVRFDGPKVDVAIPLGWQATEDWERGVAYSPDRRYRVIVWRVNFAFEGVKDAEHYAATKAGSMQARKPGLRAQARKLPDGTFLIVYENAPGEGERRTVFDLLLSKPGDPKEGVLVTLGVPAADADRGLRLMALLKQNVSVAW